MEGYKNDPKTLDKTRELDKIITNILAFCDLILRPNAFDNLDINI
jgi:hypothetical protein